MDSELYRLTFLALTAVAGAFAGTMLANAGIALILWAVNDLGPPPRRRRAAFRGPACRRQPRLPSGLVAKLIRRLMNPGRN